MENLWKTLILSRKEGGAFHLIGSFLGLFFFRYQKDCTFPILMEKTPKILSPSTRMEQLEHELHLKKLQMNSLLAITQAINNNLHEEGLYKMYNSFVTWDLGIKRLALLVNNQGKWQMVTSKGIQKKKFTKDDIPLSLSEPTKAEKNKSTFLNQFDFIIPVRHKDHPIACAYLGGIAGELDAYDKIQFITAITNFIAVGVENKRLFRAKVEQEVMNKELSLASEIQQMLLPKTLPNQTTFEIDKIYRQHSQVGGDYYDYFPLDGDRFAFCIADISGKGISAALLMANFQAILRGLIFKETSLTTLVQQLNKSIFEVTKGERFITFFIGILDLPNNTLSYINAGHIPPIMISQSKVTTLRDGCLVLGAIEQLPMIEMGYEELSRPNLIFSFTDGITDLTNDEGNYLSEEKLIDFSKEHFHLSANQFNEKLYQYVLDFKGAQSFPDDITVLTCKIKK